jgi:thiaminase/transcriptional activator TenA
VSVTTGFSARQRVATAADWESVLAHPFLRGMRDGTLPRAAFQRYMVQDYLFLVAYARVLAIASAKAVDLDAMGRMAEMLHATLNVEMALHRGFAERVGIPAPALASAAPLPACQAYTSHLLAVAWSEPLAVIAAALLPCQLGYAEIARHLAAQGPPDVAEYAEWVVAYTAPEYVQLAEWLGGQADALAASAGPRDLDQMERVYRESLRLEHGFWDMALGSDV